MAFAKVLSWKDHGNQQETKRGVMRFTIASVLLILVVGILIGLALAKWLLGAAAAIGVALIVAAVALVAYLMIRRRIRVARAERGM